MSLKDALAGLKRSILTETWVENRRDMVKVQRAAQAEKQQASEEMPPLDPEPPAQVQPVGRGPALSPAQIRELEYWEASERARNIIQQSKLEGQTTEREIAEQRDKQWLKDYGNRPIRNKINEAQKEMREERTRKEIIKQQLLDAFSKSKGRDHER